MYNSDEILSAEPRGMTRKKLMAPTKVRQGLAQCSLGLENVHRTEQIQEKNIYIINFN